MALVSLPLYKFLRPPCCYYRLQEIKKYEFGVATNGILPMPDFIKIRPAVLELKHADEQIFVDQLCVCSFYAHAEKDAQHRRRGRRRAIYIKQIPSGFN
jgi:hypothetical protein